MFPGWFMRLNFIKKMSIVLLCGVPPLVACGDDVDVLNPSGDIFIRVFKMSTDEFQMGYPQMGERKRIDFNDNKDESSSYISYDLESSKHPEPRKKVPYAYNMGRMEIWQAGPDGTYEIFRTFKICAYSGPLGPKTKRLDSTVPEGFYSISGFNPNSEFNLSLRIDYPNDVDRARNPGGDRGGDIFIHGLCKSDGCLAMDDQIESIYFWTKKASERGQSHIPVHIFPFPLTPRNMELVSEDDPNKTFWNGLIEGFNFFEENLRVPSLGIRKGKYFLQK